MVRRAGERRAEPLLDERRGRHQKCAARPAEIPIGPRADTVELSQFGVWVGKEGRMQSIVELGGW
jgi:hypothetical protein